MCAVYRVQPKAIAKPHVSDDARNKLVERTVVFAAAWRPRYVVIENVKELLRGRHKHHFQGLHRDLTAQGYEVHAEVHDLKDFGLPQSRIRSLIVAKLGGAFQLRLPKVARHTTVRDAIGHLPPLTGGRSRPLDPMHVCPNMTELSLERLRAIPRDGGSWIDIPEDKAHLRIPSMNVDKPGSFPDIYGRLAWDRVAPTVTRECSSPGNGRDCHPEQDRLLSVREMALIQGFPADYQFTGSLLDEIPADRRCGASASRLPNRKSHSRRRARTDQSVRRTNPTSYALPFSLALPSSTRRVADTNRRPAD